MTLKRRPIAAVTSNVIAAICCAPPTPIVSATDPHKNEPPDIDNAIAVK
jgi:hypothetical protein